MNYWMNNASQLYKVKYHNTWHLIVNWCLSDFKGSDCLLIVRFNHSAKEKRKKYILYVASINVSPCKCYRIKGKQPFTYQNRSIGKK